MRITHVSLLYIPFRGKPFGHVSAVFTYDSGESVAMCAEAAVPEGQKFSLWKGLFRSYRLRYRIETREAHMARYHRSGRKVHEYALDLDDAQRTALHESMHARTRELDTSHEWYNTLMNSCITNLVRHVDASRSYDRSLFDSCRLVFVPSRIAR